MTTLKQALYEVCCGSLCDEGIVEGDVDKGRWCAGATLTRWNGVRARPDIVPIFISEQRAVRRPDDGRSFQEPSSDRSGCVRIESTSPSHSVTSSSETNSPFVHPCWFRLSLGLRPRHQHHEYHSSPLPACHDNRLFTSSFPPQAQPAARLRPRIPASASSRSTSRC